MLGELPEGEVELLPDPAVLPDPAEPLEPLDMPDEPVELELDLSKYCCHSERETCPSPFLSTEVKLGEEAEPEALPPEAPLAPLLEPPADEDGVEDDEDGLDEDEEPPAEDDGVEEDDEDDGLVADEPLLDLSPAPMAVVAKPRNAAVTAALMSFNVMDEIS